MPEVTYSRGLLALAQSPEQLSPGTLWKALSVEERVAGLLSALNDKHEPWLKEYLAQAVLGQLHGFRLGTLLRWTSEQLAKKAAYLPLDRVQILRAALIALHLPGRAWLQAAFFDELPLAHEGGFLKDSLPEPVAPPENVRLAAQRLLDLYPGDQALTYLLAIRAVFPRSWPGLDPWLREFARHHLGERLTEAEQVAASPGPSSRPADLVERGSELTQSGTAVQASRFRVLSEEANPTPLDDQITIMMVNSASGVANAPSESQIDAVVDEFVRLNGLRHQSFHHAGFRDAIYGREPAKSLPAENRHRWRWYYAGFIAGLARRNRVADIERLYDRFAVVQTLGDTGLGPSRIGGPLVYGALCDARRYEEASRFVSIQAIYNDPVVAEKLLQQGTDLLRREDPATATPIFETLWQGLADRLADGLQVAPETWIPVRRRRAHCLRYADDLEGARAVLEELVDEPDEENRAAVLADLGLLDAGFRRLHELRYPPSRGDVPGLRDALERGRPRFREAADIPVRTAAHGHYTLGFLELLRGEYALAVVHLEQALAGFGQRPEVYSGSNLLVRARLHLGLALCFALSDVAHLDRARRLLHDAMSAGERIPAYLVGDVLDALGLADSAEAVRVAEDIVKASPDSTLDEVVTSQAARRCVAAADALVARARNQQRSLTERTRDWHGVLPMLLTQSRMEEAAESLDFAEEAAVQGILRQEFLALLRDERRYGPPWSPDDARWSQVRVLESAGDYTNAAGFLQQVFYVALANGGEAAEDDARQVVERLEDYPGEFQSLLTRLRDQFTSRFAGEPAATIHEPERLIRVLVVGGNETQKRFDESLIQSFKETHPHLVLEFFHSGWTSNWGIQINEFERRLDGTDGVVFSRYMRTGFGQQARKRLRGVPWRGCGGKGQGAFRNTILTLASGVQRMRARPRE